ncbi:rhodanese-like domain-containing protein [Lutibacter sp.]|uniref:rhodanese-like domain-containing protein n=1 Tax=Lutibacter sp. TaxID=1925666 RepID=UPI001A34ECF4|nr:rhodanese-like domain-containing protein [Lutibacter sp.]MBI9042040.1 rhodanese-like domain-containing protein [Lutibacter sp.]
MKELEKTKRISIAAVITILVVLIAVLSYKKPKHLYTNNTKSTLENITNNNYFVTLEELNGENLALIDVRNQFEFEKGHIENAINIYTPEILNDYNTNLLNNLKTENKTIILYGSNTNDVTIPFLMLNQLGYTNIKMAAIENSYYQNKLISKNDTIEKSYADIKGFIEESIKKASIEPKPIPVKIVAPKKVITVQKKKKKPAEGGC